MTFATADQSSTVSDPVGSGRSEDVGRSNNKGDQTLAIALSTALSVLAVITIAGSVFICCRYRQGRLPFMKRGATPIDDEEIESWKRKGQFESTFNDDKPPTMHKKHASTTSLRKPPSVVVYHNPHHEWPAMENISPRSAVSNCNGSKKSVEISQTPVLARAPNARPGLTDECVQGDDAFLPSPKRKPSRLSKYPPNASTSTTRGHGRTLSTRSSFSFGGSIRDQWFGQGYATDTELSPRSSHDNLAFQRSVTSSEVDRTHGHHRVYSSSDIPPKLSLDEVYFGGLSPRPIVPSSEIGRAIG